MTQVWTMRGLRPAGGEDPDDPLGQMSAALDEAGFTSRRRHQLRADYHRYLRPGEQVTVRSSLTEVVGPKRTALGEGWFVTTRSTWYVGTRRSLDDVPDPEVPARGTVRAAVTSRRRSRRRRTDLGRRRRRAAAGRLAGHRVLLGRAPPATSCGSSAAAAAARCATRRARCARCTASPGPSTSSPPAAAGLQLRRAPPPAGAGPDAAVRHRAGRARPRASGWSASCATSSPERWRSDCRSGSTFDRGGRRN